ncbi:MAG: AMP-binding protein [Methylobacterium frigidaeris]
MRVEHFLEESARRHPDKVALVAGPERLTFAALDGRASRLASWLHAHGLGRGDRVVVFADNSVEAVVALFAALKAGGVFSLVNPSTKADKLAFILGNCRPSAFVTQEKLVPVAAEALGQAGFAGTVLVAGDPAGLAGAVAIEEAQGWDGPAPTGAGIALDLAMLVYTSGSTGFPKGVMMTHRNVVAAATSITTYLESVPEDVVLCALPISFDYGLYQVLMAAKVGATLVLETSFAYPQAVLERAAAEGVTGLPLVPTMAALLLRLRDLAPGALPSLRYVTNTAAALPPAHIARLQALFPTARLYSMYGLTECKRCTWLPPAELARRPDSVGIAIPGTEAYVVGEDGRRLGPGETGELVIRGPHVMAGYWENEAATEAALRPGPYPWERVLHTGDLFTTDAEGFLYFVARKDDIIKSRGEKVSPKEVENALYQLAGIREAVVIGVPDEVLGQAVRAIVVLEPGSALTPLDIRAHCSRNLEDFMVPRSVVVADALPKTDTGKISRRAAAELDLARANGRAA